MLSGLRNFFLVFFLSLVGLGLGAWFLIGVIENIYGPDDGPPPVTGADGEIIANGELPEDIGEFYRFTALIIGIDAGESQKSREEIEHGWARAMAENQAESECECPDDEYECEACAGVRGDREADVIMLIDINSRTRIFTLAYLPRDMRVDAMGFTQRLGAVYAAHGMDALISTVHAYTGIRTDFFLVLDYAGIEALFNVLGEIEFDVPQDMFHLPRPYNYYDLEPAERAALRPEINLRRGRQGLDGRQAVQLLRFRGYGGGYRNEEASRISMHVNFIQAIIEQKLTLENLARAREIYDALIESIYETDMLPDDFENHAHLIFGFGDFDFRMIEYPGTRRYENGVEFFIPFAARADAVGFFSDFRRAYTEGITREQLPEMEEN